MCCWSGRKRRLVNGTVTGQRVTAVDPRMKMFGTVYCPVFSSRYLCISEPSPLVSSLYNDPETSRLVIPHMAMKEETHGMILTGTSGNSDWNSLSARRQYPQYVLENMVTVLSVMVDCVHDKVRPTTRIQS
jgi:hypothetical protein